MATKRATKRRREVAVVTGVLSPAALRALVADVRNVQRRGEYEYRTGRTEIRKPSEDEDRNGAKLRRAEVAHGVQLILLESI